MKESVLAAATRMVNILQRKHFETEAPIKQLECDLLAALQKLQQTRQELEDSEQLNETLENYIETRASRINTGFVRPKLGVALLSLSLQLTRGQHPTAGGSDLIK